MSKRPTRGKAGDSVPPTPRSEFTSVSKTNQPEQESPIASITTKPFEVVPFPSTQTPLSASDDQTRRVIVGKGTKRVAFELVLDPDQRFTTRHRMIGPNASVLPMRKVQKRKRPSGIKRDGFSQGPQ